MTENINGEGSIGSGLIEISKIDREDVADLIRRSNLPEDADSGKSFVVIDVRGDDHEGGHVTGSCNIPSHVFMEQTYVVDQLMERYLNGPISTV